MRADASRGEIVKPTIQAAVLIASLLASWSSHADPVYAPGSCVQTSPDVCADSTPCKAVGDVTACLAGTAHAPPGAFIMAESCWQYRAAFTCDSGTGVDSCKPLVDRGCGPVNTSCVSYNDSGRCMSSTVTYQCPDKPPVTTSTNVCSTSICDDGGTGCFDTTRPADGDFGKAAALMEAAREAGVYGINGGAVELFKGFKEECSVKALGGSSIKSCCTSAGGGASFTNYAVIGLTAKAAYAVGKEELKAGSKYVYDTLFHSQDANLVKEGVAAASEGLSSSAAKGVASSAGTNFGTYGFQFSYSSAGGFQYVSFDPYSFAFAVAVTIVSEWLSCDEDEQVLQMKRGQNLCVYLNSYCARKVLGVCLEKKERHCCFNSVLAKLINRQGREQLGLDLEQCGGFTAKQLQALDFSRIDLSEFIATITPKDVDAGEMEGTVRDTVDKKVGDYYGRH